MPIAFARYPIAIGFSQSTCLPGLGPRRTVCSAWRLTGVATNTASIRGSRDQIAPVSVPLARAGLAREGLEEIGLSRG
jgi:hypothetical protein